MARNTADWFLKEPVRVNGYKSICIGKPVAGNKALDGSIFFNGRGDGIFLDINPISGLFRFTVEAIFLPLSGGPDTQKFIHFGDAYGDRFLFETRVPDPQHWCFDAALHSGEPSLALMNTSLLHPLDYWYHAAVSFDGRKMKTYINGIKELSGDISAFTPIMGNRTSIGNRMDKNSGFRGEISRIRVSDDILGPEEFMDFHS